MSCWTRSLSISVLSTSNRKTVSSMTPPSIRRLRVAPRAVRTDQRIGRLRAPGSRLVFDACGRIGRVSARRSATARRRCPAARTVRRRRASRPQAGADRAASRTPACSLSASSTGSPTIFSPGRLTLRPIATQTSGLRRNAHVAGRRRRLAEHRSRGVAELDQHLGGRHRQTFAGADVDRHARPAPAVDGQLDGDIGLHRPSSGLTPGTER